MAKVVGQAKLIKRGRTYYIAIYNVETRRTDRRSLKTKDPTIAKERFASSLGNMAQTGQAALPLTVAQALDKYLRDHVAIYNLDPNRQAIAAEHLSSYFGSTPLVDIDIPKCRSYADARRSGKGVGIYARLKGRRAVNSTIKRELNVLAAAARHALKWRLILPNQMPSIELPRPDEPVRATRARFFTREQIALLLFHARGETRDIVLLCYYTAARRSSIEKLTVGQIDMDKGAINLATPGKRITKKRQALVPVLDVFRQDLQRLVKDKAPADRVFSINAFAYQFEKTCRSLRFAAPHHPHMLRHSRATHLLQDGVSIYDVATLLGDTMKTVEDHYAHHTVGDLRRKLQY